MALRNDLLIAGLVGRETLGRLRNRVPTYVDLLSSITRKHLSDGNMGNLTSLKIPISSLGYLFSSPSIHIHVGGQLATPFAGVLYT